MRWMEETKLLKEKMRRVLAYFDSKATWWTDRISAEERQVSPELSEGLRAYAESQAQLQRDLAEKFAAQWAPIRRDDITPDELRIMAKEGVDEDEVDEADGNQTGSEEEDIEEVENGDAFAWED